MLVTSQTRYPFLLSEFQSELQDILRWWIKRMTDPINGGFYGRIDGHGQLYTQANKGIILNTRILWTFAAAARQTDNPTYEQTATRAFQYLTSHFWDKEQGGVYWMLDYKGKVVANKKQIYAQAFAIYAFSEYYQLTGNQEALYLANAIFNLIEQHSHDNQKGGYFEAFSRDWQLLEDLRLSDKDANEAKTMNTHLHILEAYTNLYRVEKSSTVQKALKRLIVLFLEKFIHPNGHLNLFFDENWNLKSGDISYGHDIECSWLLVEAAEVLADKTLLKKVEKVAILMAEAVVKNGLDKDGSVFNECAANGHLDTDKHWWPQAEAVVGFWNLWQLTGAEKYQKAALRCWDFIKKYLKDSENGEWYWRIDNNRNPIGEEDKAGAWKAPYHNGRMCLEMVERGKL